MGLLRAIILLAFAGGGGWLALYGLDLFIQRSIGGEGLEFRSENTLLWLPIGLLGAIIGAFVGGMFLPRQR